MPVDTHYRHFPQNAKHYKGKLSSVPSIHSSAVHRGRILTSQRYGMTKVILTLPVRLDKGQLQISFQYQEVYETTNGSQVTLGYRTP